MPGLLACQRALSNVWCEGSNKQSTVDGKIISCSHILIGLNIHSSQMQHPAPHPVASALKLKICISSKCLQSEVCKKALLEIH